MKIFKRKLRFVRLMRWWDFIAIIIYSLLNFTERKLRMKQYFELNKLLDFFIIRTGKLEVARSQIKVQSHLKHTNIEVSAYLRKHTSDIAAWLQIIVNEVYYNLYKLIIKYTHLSVCSIVDAGANIGLATIYFARLFPNAKILSIDPDSANFNMLCKNIAIFEYRVQSVCVAFWPFEQELYLQRGTFRDGREWAIRVVHDEPSFQHLPREKIPVITPAKAENMPGNSGFDILKMDIEGAEREFI